MTFRERVRALKYQARIARLALGDPRVPRASKILAGAAIAYALSPIDLIPDFIPVLGQLDDLLLVPAAIWLALRLIPDEVMADLRAAAEDRGEASG